MSKLRLSRQVIQQKILCGANFYVCMNKAFIFDQVLFKLKCSSIFFDKTYQENSFGKKLSHCFDHTKSLTYKLFCKVVH